MRRISILLVILSTCFVLAAWPQAQPQWTHKIITFDAPGAGTGAGQGTQPNAVNCAGVVAGWYLDDNNVWYGFLRTPDGKIITFSAPGAGTGTYQGSGGWGINPAGKITGDYVDVNCVEHGFIRKPDGEFIEFEAPGAGSTPSPCVNGLWGGLQGTTPGDMNAAGEIAGIINDTNSVWHGFVRTPDGEFTTFEVPGAGTGSFQGTWVNFQEGLNGQGAATGWYIDENNNYHGYMRTAAGKFATFDGPGEGVQFTIALSTDSQGATAGVYLDASNLYHGFLRWPNGKITTIDVPGAGTGAYEGTEPEAMNDEGIIAGNYIDTNGANHGFVLTPEGRIIKFDAPGAGTGSGQGTVPYYVGDTGAVTGFFIDSSGVSHGFLAEPGNW
jgi:hypothetical protein